MQSNLLMTKKLIFAVVVFFVSAWVSDYLFTLWIPRYYFNRAINSIFDANKPRTRWLHIPRIDLSDQRIIRLNYELAFSGCYIDLSKGVYHVVMKPSPGYFSLAIFEDNTDTVFIENDQTHPEGFDLLIDLESRRKPEDGTLRKIYVSSARAFAVERRLAPDDKSFAKANSARQEDICELIK